MTGSTYIKMGASRHPLRQGAPIALLALVGGAAITALGGCRTDSKAPNGTPIHKEQPIMSQLPESEEEWKALLDEDQFLVCRMKMTEPPFTGKYWNHKEDGLYACAACGAYLFTSEAKYDSGSGWPSFWDAVASEAIATERDDSLGMVRTEILCRRCGSHLGHVFEDGPPPTGLRYCVNSASLTFRQAPEGDQ